MNRPARAVLLLALAALGTVAPARPPKAPPPPTGELLLDMADPVIELAIGKVPMRLRVALEQKRLIELNPAAAQRLRDTPPDRHFRFEPGFEARIGRETLYGIQAAARVTINDRMMLVTIASHGRDCCQGVDGEIGLGLLPYATIRFVRHGIVPTASGGGDFLIDDNSEQGPEATLAVGKESLLVQFSLQRSESVATASAGAILARAHGGRLAGGGTTLAAFGIERPTAMLTFPHPISIAGFRFDRLPVRTADFAGHLDFPADPDQPEDILVRKKVTPQPAWPVVLIGRDRLDRCAELLFDGITSRLTLRCDGGGL